jgi:hypothetical protein
MIIEASIAAYTLFIGIKIQQDSSSYAPSIGLFIASLLCFFDIIICAEFHFHMIELNNIYKSRNFYRQQLLEALETQHIVSLQNEAAQQRLENARETTEQWRHTNDHWLTTNYNDSLMQPIRPGQTNMPMFSYHVTNTVISVDDQKSDTLKQPNISKKATPQKSDQLKNLLSRRKKNV